MTYRHRVGGHEYAFDSLAHLMGAASPTRSGDQLAGCAASTAQERAAAQWALAEVPLARFLSEDVVPAETDDVTRLILDDHDPAAFAPVAHLCVGDLRDWLLARAVEPGGGARIAAVSRGLTPEMAAAVSKLMSLQDMVCVSAAVEVRTALRSTIGVPGTLASRLQPNHPTDDVRGIAAATIDGLLCGTCRSGCRRRTGR